MSISETFHQLSVRPQDLPSTSMNILSVRGKHFVRKLDLPLNFRQILVWLRVLPSSFCASSGPSVIFRKHSVQPRTSVNLHQLLRDRRIYRQLSVHPQHLSQTFRAFEGTSMNFPYVRGGFINFRQLSMHPRDYPSNFCVSAEHCVIFSKHSVQPWGLPSTSANFCTFSAPSISIQCDRGSFRHIQSTFCAVVGLSATFCQLSVRPRDLP